MYFKISKKLYGYDRTVLLLKYYFGKQLIIINILLIKLKYDHVSYFIIY